jgi:bifunctional DNase/RNase
VEGEAVDIAAGPRDTGPFGSLSRVFEDLIKLRVADVKVAVPAGNGVEAGLVVLEEEDYPHRSLRMFIGQPEARAIHGPWSNAVPPRPSTWDLFVSTMSLLDGRLDRVVITDVEELRHYFAQLVLIYQGHDDVPLLITARPSDALALALRAYGAEIYAEPHVLDTAGLLSDGTAWVRPAPSDDESDDEAESIEDGPAPAESGHTGDGEPKAPGADADDVDEAAVARAALAAEWGEGALSPHGVAPGSEPAVDPSDGSRDAGSADRPLGGKHLISGKRLAEDAAQKAKKKKKPTKEKAAKNKSDKKSEKRKADG